MKANFDYSSGTRGADGRTGNDRQRSFRRSSIGIGAMTRVRHYAEILNELFDPRPFMNVKRLFEFVCALVRAGGIQGPGWEPWHESKATIDDLQNLAAFDLPREKFPDPERTQARLALLSYCHITEMDLPYFLVANLLRLRLGQKYSMGPFDDLAKPINKKAGILQGFIPPSPTKKIKRIKELAEQAKMPRISEALSGIYDAVIRNAVYHSDYILHERRMHLRKGYRKASNGIYSPVIEFTELAALIKDAFAFYGALFSLYDRCRRSFKAGFKDIFLPYDLHYKGILELLFDSSEALAGFRVYWPNGSYGEYSRTDSGCGGQNIEFNPDGSINFMVGLYASSPGNFSPLVERDAEPNYPVCPGTNLRPYWPDKLAAYRLPR